MSTWWLLLAALLAGPIWVVLSLWLSRRTWYSVRRLAARAKGQEQLVELGQLTGGLAHEIKNPLSTINMNLKLLAEDLRRQDDDLHRRWLRRLQSVQDEADRLHTILDDFLRYAGKYELQLETTDLRRLIDELTDFFAPQADAAHVVMRTSLSDEEVRCRIDANLIKQAVLNLMINAVQAMSEGGELLINVLVRRGRGVIEVADTGPGLDPANLPRIFEVYYSTRSGGTGLGLPTTRRIIREHDGTIHVDSAPGKGTQFTVALPLARE
ncbi:MAG: ATP-binding protein [Phycisphaerae bacterium]|jgi:signal transduction histidine kinase|nr:ATP-binding protein [Phycisphaerae bacterium]MDP7636907.1 ATP-binding protein [Phycisphaerae bacterium]